MPVVEYEEEILVDPDAYYPVFLEELMMDRQRTFSTSAAHMAEGFLPTGFVSTLFDSNQARRYTFSVPARSSSTADELAQTDKLTLNPIVICHEELHVPQVE